MGIFNFHKNDTVNDNIVEENSIDKKIEEYRQNDNSEIYNKIINISNRYNINNNDFIKDIIIECYEKKINYDDIDDCLFQYSQYYKILNNDDLKMLEKIIIEAVKVNIFSEKIIEMFMLTENKILTYTLVMNLVSCVSRIKADVLELLYKYFKESRSYFVNEYTHYARLEKLLRELEYHIDLSYDTVSEYLEIDMRNAGIYNVDEVSIENLEKKLDNIKSLTDDHDSLLKTQIEKSNSYIQILDDKYNLIISNLNKEVTKNKKQAEYYKNEVENLAQYYVDKINKLLGIDTHEKEKIIQELKRCESVIKYFDPKIPFNERLDMALQNKDKNKFYDKNFDEVLEYIMMGQSVWIAGPTRCGKTTIAEGIADLLGIRYHNIGRIHDFIVQIKGYKDFNSNYIKSMFQEYFENGGLISLEEADLSDSQSLAELDHIVDNIGYKQYAFGDNTIITPNQNFRLIATANTRGMEEESGYVRNSQDKSVMNRFMIIDMDYNEDLERNMLKSDLELAEFLHSIRRVEREIKKSDSFAKTVDITTGEFKIIQEYIKNNRLNVERFMSRLLIKDLPTDYLTKLISEIEKSSNNKYIAPFKELVKKR